MTTFLDIFARSPVTGLQRHITLMLEVLHLFRGVMCAYVSGDKNTMKGLRERITTLEQKADSAKHELISQLSPQLWSPIRRSELIALANCQDMVINKTEELAVFMSAGSLELEESLAASTCERLTQYYDALVGAATCCQQVLVEMDELVETGFADRLVAKGHAILETLEGQERNAAEALALLYRHLVKMEAELPSSQLLRLHLVTDKLCQLNRDIRLFSTQFELILAH